MQKKKTFGSMQAQPVKPRGILANHEQLEKPQKAKKSKTIVGRPPLKPEERTSEKITLNLTPKEKAIASQKAGGRGLAAYLREELRKAGVLNS